MLPLLSLLVLPPAMPITVVDGGCVVVGVVVVAVVAVGNDYIIGG